MRKHYFLLLYFVITGSLFGETAQQAQGLQRTLQNFSYSINNQDQEIAHLKQKIANQESVLDSMHKEVTSLVKAAKESQKAQGTEVTSKLKSMEKNIDKLVSDLKQFKTHANDTSSSITSLQKKLAEQEEISSLQAQQIKDLEAALRSLANALQIKSGGEKAASGEYRVKSGDTLEKIAKDHGVSIDALRKENSLSKDTIYPGQKLHIP